MPAAAAGPAASASQNAGATVPYGPPVKILSFSEFEPVTEHPNDLVGGRPSEACRLALVDATGGSSLLNFLVAFTDNTIRWYLDGRRSLPNGDVEHGGKPSCRAVWRLPEEPNQASSKFRITALAVGRADSSEGRATAFVGTSVGTIWRFSVEQGSEVIVLHRLHGTSTITSLLPANYLGSLTSGLTLGLFSGDATGRIWRVWFSSHFDEPIDPEQDSHALAQLGSSVSSMEFSERRGWLLISTVERIFLIDDALNKEIRTLGESAGQPRIVGTKPHKGDLTATFAPCEAFGMGDEALLAPRPGGRLWIADGSSGTVQSTLRFGRSTSTATTTTTTTSSRAAAASSSLTTTATVATTTSTTTSGAGDAWASLGRLLLVPERKVLSWSRATAAAPISVAGEDANSLKTSTSTLFLLDLEAVSVCHEWVIPEVLDVSLAGRRHVLLAHCDHVSVLILESNSLATVRSMITLGSWEATAHQNIEFLHDMVQYVLKQKADLAANASSLEILRSLNRLILGLQKCEEEDEEAGALSRLDDAEFEKFKTWIGALEDGACRALQNQAKPESNCILPNFDVVFLANFPVVEDLSQNLKPTLPQTSLIRPTLKCNQGEAVGARDSLGLSTSILTPEQLQFSAVMQAELQDIDCSNKFKFGQDQSEDPDPDVPGPRDLPPHHSEWLDDLQRDIERYWSVGGTYVRSQQLENCLNTLLEGLDLPLRLKSSERSEALESAAQSEGAEGAAALQPLPTELQTDLSQKLLQLLPGQMKGGQAAYLNCLCAAILVILGPRPGALCLARSVVVDRLIDEHKEMLSEEFILRLRYPCGYLSWVRQIYPDRSVEEVVNTILNMLVAGAEEAAGNSDKAPTQATTTTRAEVATTATPATTATTTRAATTTATTTSKSCSSVRPTAGEQGLVEELIRICRAEDIAKIIRLLIPRMREISCPGLLLVLVEQATKVLSEDDVDEVFHLISDAIRRDHIPDRIAYAIAGLTFAHSGGPSLEWLEIGPVEDPSPPAAVQASAPALQTSVEPVVSANVFSQARLGDWVEFSPDGLSARHLDDAGEEMCGVIFSAEPLIATKTGFYYEVELTEVREEDCFDGLTVGVTQTSQGDLEFDPPTIDHIPESWAVGYDGQMWDSHSQQLSPVDWDPRSLQVGDVLGILVTSTEGELLIFRNGTAVCPGPRGIPVGPSGPPLFAVVDLLGAARAVRWRPGTVPCTS